MSFCFYVTKGTQSGIEYFSTPLSFGEIDLLAKISGDVLADRVLLKEQTPLQKNICLGDVAYKLSHKGIRNVSTFLQNGGFLSVLTFIIVPINLAELTNDIDYILEETELRDIQKLTIKTSFFLLTVDGRHRVAAIRDVLLKQPNLAFQKVPSVLIPFKSQLETMQIFGDLQLNIKPISKKPVLKDS